MKTSKSPVQSILFPDPMRNLSKIPRLPYILGLKIPLPSTHSGGRRGQNCAKKIIDFSKTGVFFKIIQEISVFDWKSMISTIFLQKS